MASVWQVGAVRVWVFALVVSKCWLSVNRCESQVRCHGEGSSLEKVGYGLRIGWARGISDHFASCVMALCFGERTAMLCSDSTEVCRAGRTASSALLQMGPYRVCVPHGAYLQTYTSLSSCPLSRSDIVQRESRDPAACGDGALSDRCALRPGGMCHAPRRPAGGRQG